MCVIWGLGTGLPRGLSPHPGSLWWDPCCEEGRYPWCLRNPTWLVGKAQRQEARNQNGRWKPSLPPLQRLCTRGRADLAQLPHARGGVYSAHLRGELPELVLLRTLVWSLCALDGGSWASPGQWSILENSDALFLLSFTFISNVRGRECKALLGNIE